MEVEPRELRRLFKHINPLRKVELRLLSVLLRRGGFSDGRSARRRPRGFHGDSIGSQRDAGDGHDEPTRSPLTIIGAGGAPTDGALPSMDGRVIGPVASMHRPTASSSCGPISTGDLVAISTGGGGGGGSGGATSAAGRSSSKQPSRSRRPAPQFQFGPRPPPVWPPDGLSTAMHATTTPALVPRPSDAATHAATTPALVRRPSAGGMKVEWRRAPVAPTQTAAVRYARYDARMSIGWPPTSPSLPAHGSHAIESLATPSSSSHLAQASHVRQPTLSVARPQSACTRPPTQLISSSSSAVVVPAVSQPRPASAPVWTGRPQKLITAPMQAEMAAIVFGGG